MECVEGAIDDSRSNDVATLTGSGGLGMKGYGRASPLALLLLEGGPQDGQSLGRLRRSRGIVVQSGDGVVGIVLGQQLGGVLLLLLLLGQ